jgi:hypothetical protein
MSFRGAIPDFMLANRMYTGAIVSFFTVTDAGVSTGVLATLYAGPTGSHTVANPQTLDSEGKFAAPVYTDVALIAQAVGPNIGSHTIGPIGARGTWRGDWVTATRYYVNDTLGDPAEPYTIYIAAEDFTAGATFAADKAAGKVQLRVRGGDRAFFTCDMPGRVPSTEQARLLITERMTILATAPGSAASSLVAATAQAVFSLKKAGVEFGTLTFGAGQTTGVFAVAADTVFDGTAAAPVELRLVAPNPQDAALADFAMTLRLNRTPLS